MDIKDKYRNLMKRKKGEEEVLTPADEVNIKRNKHVYAEPKPLQLERAAITETKQDTEEQARHSQDQREREAVAGGCGDMRNASRECQTILAPSKVNDKMTLTVFNEKKNLVVSLKRRLLGQALLEFSKREFKLDFDPVLVAEGSNVVLLAEKSIDEQVQQFDLIRIVKPERPE